jgi:hypothetical protein
MKTFLFAVFTVMMMTACHHVDKTLGIGNSDSTVSLSKKSLMADTANYTTIEWLDSTYQDKGKVVKGQDVEIVYNFRNNGDKPLIIVNAAPQCGCTVTDIPKEPIAPGEVGKIRAKFSSKSQMPGEHRKSIALTANTKPTGITDLSFRVEVTEK